MASKGAANWGPALEVGRAAVTAVLEDNFRPDLGLHPGVRHQFDDFPELAARLGIPRDGYMQWLTGDARGYQRGHRAELLEALDQPAPSPRRRVIMSAWRSLAAS